MNLMNNNYYGLDTINAYVTLKDFFSLQVSNTIENREAFMNEIAESIRKLDVTPETLYLLVDLAEDKEEDIYYFDLLITILLFKGYTFLGSKFLPTLKFSVATEENILEAYTARYFMGERNIDAANPEAISKLVMMRNLFISPSQGGRSKLIAEAYMNLPKIYENTSEGKTYLNQFIERSLFSRAELENIFKVYNIVPVPARKQEMVSLLNSHDNKKVCNPVAKQFCDQYGETGEINCQITNSLGGLCVNDRVIDSIPRNKMALYDGKPMYGQTYTLDAYLNKNGVYPNNTPMVNTIPRTLSSGKYYSPLKYSATRTFGPRTFGPGIQALVKNSMEPRVLTSQPKTLSSAAIYSTPTSQPNPDQVIVNGVTYEKKN